MLRAVGGWDETLTCWQDYELGFRLLRAAPHPAWCSSVFHRIYRTPDSITGASLSENAEGIVQVLCKLANKVEKAVDFSLQSAPNPPETIFFSSETADGASTLAQCRLALWMRVHIIAGQFRAEGAPPRRHHCFPQFVHHFAAFRGSIAWWLAYLWPIPHAVDAVLGDLQHFGRAFVEFFAHNAPKTAPKVSKIHTARKTEQVIVRLICAKDDYVW